MSKQVERVLVVDDDESILLLLTTALERNGYQVVGTLGGIEALKLLQSPPPFAVLLTDLMMPRMSGTELLTRARELDPFLEIIVITAAGSIESAITALRDGRAYDYLLKPLDSMHQLTVVVDRAVAHRQLILERAALQQQAEANARRFEALVVNVSEAILAVSEDGMITVANPPAERMFNRQNLVGIPAQSVLPPKLTNSVENWQAIGGGYPASLEYQWIDGSTRMVSLTSLLDPDGKNKGWVMVLRDITPLKRLEKLKTQALSDAISKIRVPLAEAMSAVVDLHLRAAQDERLSASLFRLTKVWERLQSWGDELLTVMKGDADWNVKPVRVDLGAVMRTLQNGQIIKRYLQAGGKLEMRLDESLPDVLTDPEALNLVLQELLRRAISRSPRGQVIIHTRSARSQVWIEISDDGPSTGDTDPLESFDRSVNELPSNLGSMSLELARARTILDRLDGQLWVSGQGLKGSTLILCLPAAGLSTEEGEEQTG